MIEQWGQREPRRTPDARRRWLVGVAAFVVVAVVAFTAVRSLGLRSTSAEPAPTGIVELLLLDAQDDRPIAGDVRFDSTPAVALGAGRYAARLPTDATISSVRAEGYRPAGLAARRDSGAVLHLVPAVVRGAISDDAGAPVVRATIRMGETIVQSDANGRFTIADVPESPGLEIMAPGFRSMAVSVGDRVDLAVQLARQEIHAAYLSFYGVAEPTMRDHVIEMVETGQINAVVVDVKGDLGYVSYPSAVPLVEQIGADEIMTIRDPKAFLTSLKARGAYTIARIVVFKDDVLARHGPAAGLDVAVTDATTGAIWTDRETLGWVDPFREEVWDYNIALAEEAIQKGFDEVQFDYVRFPTDPGRDTELDRAQFSQNPTTETRPRAIASFLGKARDVVHGVGGALAADIFGYVSWRDDDLGIGQQFEMLAASVDYLSPMVYPSTFEGLPMEPSYTDSPAYPYETVYFTLKRARERVAGSGVAIRPWLQYFDDYPWASGKRYGPDDLAAQGRAVADLGLSGWMWWDPTNLYRHSNVSE